MHQQKIKVVSKRYGGVQPHYTDTVIDIDRTNRILGNPIILRNKHDDVERERVISEYAELVLEDVQNNGPISREINRIANLVKDGKTISLRCWCAPKLCHGDVLKYFIEKRLDAITR